MDCERSEERRDSSASGAGGASLDCIPRDERTRAESALFSRPVRVFRPVFPRTDVSIHHPAMHHLSFFFAQQFAVAAHDLELVQHEHVGLLGRIGQFDRRVFQDERPHVVAKTIGVQRAFDRSLALDAFGERLEHGLLAARFRRRQLWDGCCAYYLRIRGVYVVSAFVSGQTSHRLTLSNCSNTFMAISGGSLSSDTSSSSASTRLSPIFVCR